jgi:hypothetical protein
LALTFTTTAIKRDVLEPIYKKASEALGREFPYPTK